MSAGAAVLKFEGMANGDPGPFDGQYLLEYDPERDGETPEGRPMIAHILATPDPSKALRFPGAREALECWKRTCERDPTRPDGRPNRPLTAFTVAVVPAEDGE